MKRFKPDKNALLTLRLLIVFASVLLMVAVRIYIPINVIVGIIAVAVGTADIFLDFIYLPLFFKSLSYESTKDKITRHGGVIFKSHKSVRYATVQYTAVITMPFSQYTGLNFVILFVYGGQLPLLFLKEEDALEILEMTGNSAEKEEE